MNIQMKTKSYDFFISQNEQNIHTDVSCGVASLMMLLKANKKTLPTYESLCDALYLTKPPQEKGYSENDPPIGLYPEDLFRYVIQHQFKFRMSFFENEWDNALKKAPIMTLMYGDEEKFGQEAHWIVLMNKKTILLLTLIRGIKPMNPMFNTYQLQIFSDAIQVLPYSYYKI